MHIPGRKQYITIQLHLLRIMDFLKEDFFSPFECSVHPAHLHDVDKLSNVNGVNKDIQGLMLCHQNEHSV